MKHVGAVLLLTSLAACAATPTPDVPLRPIQPFISSAINDPANTRLGAASGLQTEASYSIPPPVVLPAAAAAAGAGISLDFADTDIRTVVAQILGQILHVNYTIDPHVHGSATFHSATPIAAGQLLPILQAVLAENGAMLVQSGSLYNVVLNANAGGASSGTPGGSVANSTVIPLHYASAADLVSVLQPFVGPGGKIIAAPSGNAVLVTGDPATQQTLISLVSAFDVDTLAGQSYALLPIGSGAAKDTAEALETALAGKSALANDVRIVPLTRIDAILVVAGRPQEIDDVRRVYSLIERNQAQSVRTWNVYYLQASQAENLAYVLQSSFTPDNITAVPDNSQAQVAGSANAGSSGIGTSTGISAAGAGSSGIGSAGNAGLGPASAGVSSSPVASSDLSNASANPLLGGLGGAGGSDGSTDAMRIVPDPQNNALLIYATPAEDDLINTMLAKLDILPLEVRIDAVIAEVDLNNTLQYGTQFFFKSGGVNGALNNTASASPLTTSLQNTAFNSTFPGFIIGGNGIGGAPLALSALNAVTKVQVLSSPELLVLNNMTAQLQVGSLVPYLTSSSQSTLTTGSPVINSINYEPTGVNLNVTPQVNQNGLVMLKISQNVSSVDTSTTNTSGIGSPTFLQRSITTSVVVQDGQTIGLAGLISDNASHSNSGIPWLKDIPILGFLAGTQNNVRDRTELLVLLTPYVVYNQQDARALTQDLLESLPNAATVPYALTRPPVGNDDPNMPYHDLSQ